MMGPKPFSLRPRRNTLRTWIIDLYTRDMKRYFRRERKTMKNEQSSKSREILKKTLKTSKMQLIESKWARAHPKSLKACQVTLITLTWRDIIKAWKTTKSRKNIILRDRSTNKKKSIKSNAHSNLILTPIQRKLIAQITV